MLFEIDTVSETPIYKQIRDQIVFGIATGDLIPGEGLSSVRQLADEININMMTVSKAYNLLKDEGYILTDRRKGTQVADYPHKDRHFIDYYYQQLSQLMAEAAIHHYTVAEVQQDIQELFQQFGKGDF